MDRHDGHVRNPRDIANRLHDEVEKAAASPEFMERLIKRGADVWTVRRVQFDACIKEEIAGNAKLVKAAGRQPQ